MHGLTDGFGLDSVTAKNSLNKRTMIICSDVDGVILNYIQGFIDFTRDEDIDYQYNP